MREILFKAKRADNGEWVTGYYIKSIVECSVFGYIRESIFGTDIKIMLNTLCQYTGLSDKNGNLIWENDVVRIKYDDDFSEVGWIKYSNCGVRYNFVFGTEIYSIDDSCDIEVIGSIFDNPELMHE